MKENNDININEVILNINQDFKEKYKIELNINLYIDYYENEENKINMLEILIENKCEKNILLSL